jgi:hypothetical protein
MSHLNIWNSLFLWRRVLPSFQAPNSLKFCTHFWSLPPLHSALTASQIHSFHNGHTNLWADAQINLFQPRRPICSWGRTGTRCWKRWCHSFDKSWLRSSWAFRISCSLTCLLTCCCYPPMRKAVWTLQHSAARCAGCNAAWSMLTGLFAGSNDTERSPCCQCPQIVGFSIDRPANTGTRRRIANNFTCNWSGELVQQELVQQEYKHRK